MSEQVKRLRDGFEAWNRREWDEAIPRYFSPDLVWRTGGFFPGLQPVYEGHNGLRQFFQDFVEPWDEISIRLEEVLHDRPGQVLVLAGFAARGRDGIEVGGSFFQVWSFDEIPLVVEFNGFETESEARRAAGLVP